MKSLRQQLQSRISIRRNTISYMEREVVAIKSIIKRVGVVGIPQIRDDLYSTRSILKDLRADQKLDKVLYVKLLEEENWIRQWNAA